MPEEANSKSDNWMERLAKVKAARARLENYYGDSDALAVLEKHIADEKWEIRQCVADAIPLLPEKLLAEMRDKGAKARAELDLLKIRR